jgi:cytosolic carboxypeptidase protein 6
MKQSCRHLAISLRVLIAVLFASTFISAASAQAAETAEKKVVLQERKKWEFKEDGITFNNEFAGARVSECSRLGKDEYRILIKPENAPVNNSAWYAFQVQAKEEKSIVVRVIYEGGGHRYRPKTSTDGSSWEPLATNLWQVSPRRTELTLQLKVPTEPLWVSGQEIITQETLNEWFENIVIQPYITRTNIGKSMANRPIESFEINDDAPPNYVFLISRQHPPEVTGQLGLMRFIETLTIDSALGQRFRERFRVFVVPMVNPDGVYEGQWRHNLGGVDLNRDWVKFAQPETRAVRDAIVECLKEEGAKPYLLIDFHSTDQDIFYTQKEDAKIFPPGFTDAWLAKIKERLPEYEPNRSGDHNAGMPTSKYWGYEQYGIAAITFEFGDNTDRSFIRELSRTAAEEMMKLLIEADKVQNPPTPQ